MAELLVKGVVYTVMCAILGVMGLLAFASIASYVFLGVMLLVDLWLWL